MDPVKISSSPSPETENDRCETGNSSPKAPGAHTSSQDQPNTFEVPPETFRRYIPVTIDASQIADPDPKKTAHVSSPSTGTGESDYIYNVKWISFRGSQCPVVTQNENGPCPIIAIANVLSLRRIFTLSEKTELLTGQRLVSLLSDILLSQPPPSSDDGLLLNYETTVSDAFNLFPSLQTGLDINVRFNGVGAFEFTPALGVFDLFKIPLYHGWVVDPEEKDLVAVVGDRTYNQLVEQVIDLKASTDPEKVTQGLLAEEFLAQTASQLTYHGLCELASTISDGHLAVLFRNNHYNAIFKHEGRIYVLVTDMGLLHEPNVVWEVLNDVDGDTQFVDSSFHLYVPSSQTLNSSSANPPVAAESKLPESAHSQSNIASLHDLERVCSEHLKLPSSSSEHGGTDMDLAARLQLAEIESSKQATKPESGSKVIPVPASAVNEKKCVSTDKLSHVCSEELLAQAQRELGTGSDLDVAVQLQWEEMNQTPDQSPASTRRPVSSTTSSSTRRGSHRRNSTSERDRSSQTSRSKGELVSPALYDSAIPYLSAQCKIQHNRLPSANEIFKLIYNHRSALCRSKNLQPIFMLVQSSIRCRISSELLRRMYKSVASFERRAYTSGRHHTVGHSVSDATRSLAEGVLKGDRFSLSRSITLVESTHPDMRREGQFILSQAIDSVAKRESQSGQYSLRIGLSGPPGVGKSSFIEAIGCRLTGAVPWTKKGSGESDSTSIPTDKHRVAVLAIDPSSQSTGGSLLADKTRMPVLSVDPNAYIRPSPSGGSLGGVARSTNETVVLCDACGFDVVFVETVGVGQSEVAVADMVDLFVLVIPPAGGDELQGIKRGIVEYADLVLVNKADGDLITPAQRIAREYTSALKYMRKRHVNWIPKVLLVSSHEGTGLIEFWNQVLKFKEEQVKSGELVNMRKKQLKVWMWNYIKEGIWTHFNNHPLIHDQLDQYEHLVETGEMAPGKAAEKIVQLFLQKP